MTDYRDEYVPDPPVKRIPKFWEEGLYKQAYDDEGGGDADAKNS
jgi:hypothetical protein